MKILVIDDDELVLMTCRKALTKEGYTVLESSNGNQGVEMYKQNSPEVVITDMLMPDKEGLETITDIRAINPEAKIIAISSGGTTGNMTFLQLAKEIGADYVLKKPFRPSEILALVEKIAST